MSYQLPPRLRSLTPYQPLEGNYRIRLDANESFLALPGMLREEISEEISRLPFHRYPDPNCTALCKAFAAYCGVQSELVVAGNGSDELIGLIVSSFLEPGQTMAIVSPDFSMYGFYAQMNDLRLVSFEKDPASLALDVDQLIVFCKREEAKLLLFSNPCNPTSLCIARQALLQLADALPDCLIAADEAYMDFSEGSVLDEIDRRDNLLVLKTCSKAFGMAAIRLGFAIAPLPIARALRAVKSPYNVSALTQAAGQVLLSHPEYLMSCIEQIKSARDRLYRRLCKQFEQHRAVEAIYNTQANFVFLRLQNSKQLFEALLGQGIAVRQMGDCLRITAGSDEENDHLLEALKELLG